MIVHVEALCLKFYLLHKKINKREKENKKADKDCLLKRCLTIAFLSIFTKLEKR